MEAFCSPLQPVFAKMTFAKELAQVYPCPPATYTQMSVADTLRLLGTRVSKAFSCESGVVGDFFGAWQAAPHSLGGEWVDSMGTQSEARVATKKSDAPCSTSVIKSERGVGAKKNFLYSFAGERWLPALGTGGGGQLLVRTNRLEGSWRQTEAIGRSDRSPKEGAGGTPLPL